MVRCLDLIESPDQTVSGAAGRVVEGICAGRSSDEPASDPLPRWRCVFALRTQGEIAGSGRADSLDDSAARAGRRRLPKGEP
jgi:hypothetical protein